MISGTRTPVIARVLRGSYVESEHRGGVAVADSMGRILQHAGDEMLLTALRSSAKPFQLLPLVESGAVERFGFTSAELAIMAGSHSGSGEHVALVRSILRKTGIDEMQLQCGIHLPFDEATALQITKSGGTPSPVHNNCSGKHAGMLALAKHLGSPLDSYLDQNHHVQHAIRAALGWAAGIRSESIGIAIDGCSAPTFFLPLSGAAVAYARLAGAREGKELRETAMARIFSAMTANPELVSGAGRFDTRVMREMPNVCAKSGAEGFQALGMKLEGGKAIGIAVKVWDGSGRAAGPVALEALRLVTETFPESLEELRSPLQKNHRGTEVGRIEPVVDFAEE